MPEETIDHRPDCQLLTVETYGLCTCDFDERKRVEELMQTRATSFPDGESYINLISNPSK